MPDSIRERLAEPLTTQGRAPVVDMIAPAAPATEPDDALAALLPPLARPGDLPAELAALLVNHERAKRRKSVADAMSKALGPEIVKMRNRIVELKAEHQIAPDEWVAVPDGMGFDIAPYEHRQVWPKYLVDPETDKSHTPVELVAVLREIGLDEIVVESAERYAWPRYVRTRLADWRRRCGDTGVLDADGDHVDADGVKLTDGEVADDPTADALCLPVALRRIVEPTETLDIRYTRTRADRPDDDDSAADEETGDTATGA